MGWDDQWSGMQLGDMMKIYIFAILLLLLPVALAADYGDGDYGDGRYGGVSGSRDGNGGGGGGSPFVDTSIASIITKELIDQATPTRFEVGNKDIPVSYIILTTNTQAFNVQLKVISLNSKPFSLSTPAKDYVKIYRYLDIQKKNVNDTNIRDASITFTVTKQWLDEQGMQERDVILLRWYDLKWNELETSIIESNNESIVFTAITPGFSYFAIALRQAPAVEASTPINPNNVVGVQPDTNNNVNLVNNSQGVINNQQPESLSNTKDDTPEAALSAITLASIISIVVFCIVLVSIMHVWRKRKLKQEIPTNKSLSDKDRLAITQFIEKARQAKMTDEQIVQKLRKARLTDEHIKSFNFNPEMMQKK